MGSRARAIRFLDHRHHHAVEAAKSAKSVEEWEAQSICPLCGQAPESHVHWIWVCSHPVQMAIRARAYQTLTSLGADLSPHKQVILRFLAKLSHEPYGSRVVLGIWREDQLAALQAEHFQVYRETAADILGLLHSPMELMVHALWDSRACILAGKSSQETQSIQERCEIQCPAV